MRIWSIAVLCALLPALPGTALAAPDPLAMVRGSVEEVLGALRDPALDRAERRARVREVVERRFDFRAMSRRILARHWKKAKPEEQARFVALFTELVENTYMATIEAYTDQQVRYPRQRVKGKRAEVSTVIVSEGLETPVDYRLRLKGGQWRVYDVRVEGVSLISNYRGTFGAIVQKDGMDGLLRSIQQKVATQRAREAAGPEAS